MEEPISPVSNHGGHHRNLSQSSAKENADPNDWVVEDVTDQGYEGDIETLHPTEEEANDSQSANPSSDSSPEDTPIGPFSNEHLARQFQTLQVGQLADINVHEDNAEKPAGLGHKRTLSEATTEVLSTAAQYSATPTTVTYKAGTRRGVKRRRHVFDRPSDDNVFPLENPPKMAETTQTSPPASSGNVRENGSRLPLADIGVGHDVESESYFVYESDDVGEENLDVVHTCVDVRMDERGAVGHNGAEDNTGTVEDSSKGGDRAAAGHEMDIE